MNDLISRQAATTIPVMPKEHRHYQTNNLDDAYEQGWNDLQECIENLPPVQPKRGKWIERGTWSEGYGMGETYGKYWACNQCGREVKGFWGECGKNFCDNCGADMRGGKDGTD